MRVHQPLALSVLAGFVALTCACGGSSASKGAGATPGATVAPTPGAQSFLSSANAAADAVLLKLSDLPAGWTAAPHSNTALTGFTGDCAALNPDDLVAGSSARKISDDFSGPGGNTAGGYVDVFETTAKATATLNALAATIARCHDQFVTVSTRALQQQGGSQLSNINVTFRDLQAGPLGDDTHAYRTVWTYDVAGRPQSTSTDIIFIRQGVIIAQVIATAQGGGATAAGDLARSVAARLAPAVAAVLPQ